MDYFHVSNDTLEKGFNLTPQYGKKIMDSRVYTLNDSNHAQYLREMIIEEYRAIHFPDKPSRLDSVYLFDDIRLALKFKNNQGKKFIYRVEVDQSAKVHKADMNLMDLTVRRQIEKIRHIAKQFYSGKSTDSPYYELLCDGEVKVNGKLEVHQQN